VIKLPLTIRIPTDLGVGAKAEEVVVHSVADWRTFQKAHFSPVYLGLVACAYLGNVTVVNGRSPGFMLGNGRIWFQKDFKEPQIRVTAINLYPLDTNGVAEACVPQKD
jgi:hypothetical protein